MEYSETVPVQYASGSTYFMGMNILVDPRVFIPRPETELLVREAAALCQKRSAVDPLILEMGTGSGIIPIGMKSLIPGCRILSVDISPGALEVAGLNIKRCVGEGGVTLCESDMFENIDSAYEGTFDAVLSNPPYVSCGDYEKTDAWIKAEPSQALLAGEEGMDCLNILAKESGRFLKPGGFLAVEIGYDQASKVKSLFREHGFERIKSFYDMNSYERVIAGWKNG